MNKEDKNIIDAIKNISIEIVECLYNIEIKNNCDYYNDRLKECELLEDSLYEKIDNNKYKEVVNYLVKDLVNNISLIINSAINNDIEKIKTYRIINNLKNKDIKVDRNNIISLMDYLSYYLELDIINTFIYILNICINNSNYANYKDDLIKFKCNLAYLYKEADINNIELYWGSFGVADLINLENYDDYLYLYTKDIYDSIIANIIDLDDLNDSKNIIYHIILRAMNLFGDSDLIYETIDKISILVKNNANILSFNDIKKLNSLVDVFVSYTEDKRLVKKIRFRV